MITLSQRIEQELQQRRNAFSEKREKINQLSRELEDEDRNIRQLQRDLVDLKAIEEKRQEQYRKELTRKL